MTNIYDDVLFDYQKKTIDTLIPHNKHMIGLDMGLGKTLTALSMLEIRFKTMGKRRALILCQKTKKLDWLDDVEKYFDVPVVVLEGTKTKQIKLLKQYEGKEVIVVASYATAKNRDAYLKWTFADNTDADTIIDYPHDMSLVIDESQTFKGRKSKIGVWGISLCNKIKYVSLLSGDPISKKYEDLYNQMKMLGMEMEWYDFADMFCITEMKSMGAKMFPTITGYKNTEILFNALHSQSVLIKTEDVRELPEQNIYDIVLKADKNNKTYNSILNNRVISWGKDEDLVIHEFEQMGVLKMALRQAASGFVRDSKQFSNHKLEAAKDLINSTHDSFVLFYNFNQELHGLKAMLKKEKIKVYEVNGHVNEYEMAKTETGRHVLLVHYSSGSKGLNLQHLKRTIYYSPTEKGEEYKQSLKRTHRIGQTQPVFYYRFITKGTVERAVYRSLELSQDYTEAMFKADVENNTWGGE